MGNHEDPCIVCGENTMTAFNYDCEKRHNTQQIRARLDELKKRNRDYERQKIARLEELLYKAAKDDRAKRIREDLS